MTWSSGSHTRVNARKGRPVRVKIRELIWKFAERFHAVRKVVRLRAACAEGIVKMWFVAGAPGHEHADESDLRYDCIERDPSSYKDAVEHLSLEHVLSRPDERRS